MNRKTTARILQFACIGAIILHLTMSTFYMINNELAISLASWVALVFDMFVFEYASDVVDGKE